MRRTPSKTFEEEDSPNTNAAEEDAGLRDTCARTEATFSSERQRYTTCTRPSRRSGSSWLPSRLFRKVLAKDLRERRPRAFSGTGAVQDWEAGKDGKLAVLRELLARQRPNDKVLVFTQFADTAVYLERELTGAGHHADCRRDRRVG